MPPAHALVTILPCNDLSAAEHFFSRLGFTPSGHYDDHYRILADAQGANIHLTRAAPGALLSADNPFGLYLYTEQVDELAAEFRAGIIEKHAPEDKPWGMYEFAINGPDGILVRVGRPSRNSGEKQSASSPGSELLKDARSGPAVAADYGEALLALKGTVRSDLDLEF